MERICVTVTDYARHAALRHLLLSLTVAGCAWGATPPNALREAVQGLPRPVWWRSQARLAVLDLMNDPRLSGNAAEQAGGDQP